MEWLINGLLPMNNRAIDVAPEGGCKTILGCWESVCIAADRPFFGHTVTPGAVLIADKETPLESLENHLNRFSQGLGYSDYQQLPNPIWIHRDLDLYFDRKTAMDKLINEVKITKPIFIRLDSLLAMLPPNPRQGINENSSQLGGIIGHDLNLLLKETKGSTQMAVHSKKAMAEWTLQQYNEAEVQTVARGHSGIVGEGSDTAYFVVKLSEHPKPTRFAIVTKSRRSAIEKKTIYVEMKEEYYGKGWARLEEISADQLPPSDEAKVIYQYMKAMADIGEDVRSARNITYDLAFHQNSKLRAGVQELLARKVLTNKTLPNQYKLNEDMWKECNHDYLKQL